MTITTARIILFLMALVGIYDIYLMKTGKKTISQRIQIWQPKYVDTIIFFILMGIAWGIWGEVGFIKILYGCLAVHFFVQQPRS